MAFLFEQAFCFDGPSSETSGVSFLLTRFFAGGWDGLTSGTGPVLGDFGANHFLGGASMFSDAGHLAGMEGVGAGSDSSPLGGSHLIFIVAQRKQAALGPDCLKHFLPAFKHLRQAGFLGPHCSPALRVFSLAGSTPVLVTFSSHHA